MGGGRYEQVQRDRVRERGGSCGADTLGGIRSKICRLGTLGWFELTLGCCTLAPLPAWWQDPPACCPLRGVYCAGGRGGGGREAPPCQGPHRTYLRRGQCRCDHRCHHCWAFASHQLSQSRRRGGPWTSILPTSCCCATAAVAAAAAAAAAVGRCMHWRPLLLSLSLSQH